jgi:hypothetical protein
MSRDPWHRDYRRLETLARELIEQCGHFHRITKAGGDDTARGMFVRSRTDEMAKIGRRLAARWERLAQERVRREGQ